MTDSPTVTIRERTLLTIVMGILCAVLGGWASFYAAQQVENRAASESREALLQEITRLGASAERSTIRLDKMDVQANQINDLNSKVSRVQGQLDEIDRRLEAIYDGVVTKGAPPH